MYMCWVVVLFLFVNILLVSHCGWWLCLFPSTEDAKSRATKRKKVAVPKDPNAPKRPVTAYIIFSTEVRQKLHSDQPEMGFVELMRHIGGLWNNLPAKDKQVDMSFID